MRTGLLIGIGSGLVSGLVLASAAKSTTGGFLLLFFLSPLPIAIAGLGWGWLSALAASIAAASALAGILQMQTAVSHLFAIGLPLTGASYLLLLNRQYQPQGFRQPLVTEWYPIGRLLAALAFAAGALATFALLSVASDAAGLEAVIRTAFEGISEKLSNLNIGAPGGEAKTAATKAADAKVTAADIERIIKYVTNNLGAVIATTWILVWCVNLWLAAKITRTSGLMNRPQPDLSTICAPRALSIAFALAALLSFVPDYPGMIAKSFASAFLSVYVLVGLAVLHNITRGNVARPFILAGVYSSLVIFQPVSALIIAMIALGEPFLPIRRKGPFDSDYPPPVQPT